MRYECDFIEIYLFTSRVQDAKSMLIFGLHKLETSSGVGRGPEDAMIAPVDDRGATSSSSSPSLRIKRHQNHFLHS